MKINQYRPKIRKCYKPNLLRRSTYRIQNETVRINKMPALKCYRISRGWENEENFELFD